MKRSGGSNEFRIQGILILVAIAVLMNGLFASLPRLILKKEATVWSDRIHLRDLVSDSQSLPRDLGDLLIAPAPKAGQQERFSIAEIRKKLQANRVMVSDIGGAEQIAVFRAGKEILPAQFKSEITNYILEHIADQERLNVEITSTQPIIAPEDTQWRLHPAGSQELIGTTLFSLEGLDRESGRVILQRWINVRVDREARLAISNRTLSSGEEIKKEDIRFEWRSLSPATLEAFNAHNSPVGRQTDRLLPANQVVTPAYIRQNYLVLRGVTATLIARSNGVSATTPVMVLENGTLGQWVLVQNSRSSKNFRAKVSGKNQLEVPIQ